MAAGFMCSILISKQADLHPILDLITVNSDIVATLSLSDVATADPDDEMFIASAGR